MSNVISYRCDRCADVTNDLMGNIWFADTDGMEFHLCYHCWKIVREQLNKEAECD